MQKRWKWWVSLLLSLTLLFAGCGAAKTADNTAASASSSAQGSAKAAVQTSVPQGTISIKIDRKSVV